MDILALLFLPTIFMVVIFGAVECDRRDRLECAKTHTVQECQDILK